MSVKRNIQLAEKEMLRSCHRMRFGAVLVLRNGKVYKGHNMNYKSHPMLKKCYASHCLSIHAELSCFLKAQGKDMRGASLYVVRRDKAGLLKPARPCTGCMRLCRDYGVKHLHYSIVNGYATEEIL